MNDLPSNSHKSKELAKPKTEKRMEPVVSAPASIEKPSAFKRVMDSFIKTDAKTIRDFMIDDFIIPNIKKGILEVINMIFYNTPTTQKSQGWNSPKISYGGFVNGTAQNSHRTQTKRDVGFNFDKIVFASRGDAERVLNAMCGAIEQYGVVSVLDLYDLAHISVDIFTADKYGWKDLSTADVVRGSDGYYLKLPDIKPI